MTTTINDNNNNNSGNDNDSDSDRKSRIQNVFTPVLAFIKIIVMDSRFQ